MTHTAQRPFLHKRPNAERQTNIPELVLRAFTHTQARLHPPCDPTAADRALRFSVAFAC